jgi:hypothetical protein
MAVETVKVMIPYFTISLLRQQLLRSGLPACIGREVSMNGGHKSGHSTEDRIAMVPGILPIALELMAKRYN